MRNKLIFKDKELKEYDSRILGICGENEQEILIFSFEDGFIDGICYLELEFPNGDKGFIGLEKYVENECYKLEVKNSLLKYDGIIKMQLKIVQGTAIWKSKDFKMYVLEAINATETIEEDYPDFVTTTTTKLEELEKNKQDKLVPGDNITIKDGVISATGGITEETDPTVPAWAKKPNKPSYTAEEVGALPDNTLLFSGDYNDLTNKPEIPSIDGLASEQYVQDEIGKIDIPSVEGLASETYVDEKVASIDIPEEVVIGTEEPTTDDWKIFIDENEEGPEYVEKNNVETEIIAESINPVSGGAVKTYIDTQIGNIETLLAEV